MGVMQERKVRYSPLGSVRRLLNNTVQMTNVTLAVDGKRYIVF